MEVKVTGHSHSAQSTLHYIYYGKYKLGKGSYNLAHRNPNGIRNRNEMIFGINCHRNYSGALNDFKHYLHQKPHNKVQTLNVVLSFDKKDFNFNNPEDCFEASEIASNFVHQAFPDHQAIVALQHDNKNDIPHIHCVMNAISMKPPYKTINGKYYGIGRLRSIGQDCIDEYQNQFHHQITGITEHQGNGYQKPSQYQRVVINALDKVMKQPEVNSPSKLRNALKPYGIRASFKRRGTRRRRQRKRRNGRKYRRSGLVFKYVTTVNGKKRNHYIRASRLANVDPKYNYQDIMNQLASNKLKLRQQKALARQKRVHHIEVEHRRKVSEQRKELISNERSRISRQTHQRLIRLAKINRRKSAELPEPLEPHFVPVAVSNSEDSSSDQQASREDQPSDPSNAEYRSQPGRQRHPSVLADFLARFNAACQRIKRLHLKARIARIKRYVHQKVHQRLAQIRNQVSERAEQLRDQIIQRNTQRKRQNEIKLRRKRHQRWEHEHGDEREL